MQQQHQCAKAAKSCPINILNNRRKSELPLVRCREIDDLLATSVPPPRRLFTIGPGQHRLASKSHHHHILQVDNNAGTSNFSRSLGPDQNMPSFLAFSVSSLTQAESENEDSSSSAEHRPEKCQQIDVRLGDDDAKAVLEIFKSAKLKLEILANESINSLAADQRDADAFGGWELVSQDISFLDGNADAEGNGHSILRVIRRRRFSSQAGTDSSATAKPTSVYKLGQMATSLVASKKHDDRPKLPANLGQQQYYNFTERRALSVVESSEMLSTAASFFMPLMMTEEEISLLWESFNQVKHEASEIGPLTIHKIASIVPETFERFIVNSSPNQSSSHGLLQVGDDRWEVMQQGFTFLNGIERCLLRLKKPLVLQRYIRQLTTTHRFKYDVGTDKLCSALNVFGTVLMEFLQAKHSHCSQILCQKCAVWTKFIGLMSLLIISNDNNLHETFTSSS